MSPPKTTRESSTTPHRPSARIDTAAASPAIRLTATPDEKSHAAALELLTILTQQGEWQDHAATYETSWDESISTAIRVPIGTWLNRHDRDTLPDAIAALSTAMEIALGTRLSFHMDRATPYRGAPYHYVEFQFEGDTTAPDMQQQVKAAEKDIISALRPLSHHSYHSSSTYLM